jgi:hypothetical protein
VPTLPNATETAKRRNETKKEYTVVFVEHTKVVGAVFWRKKAVDAAMD